MTTIRKVRSNYRFLKRLYSILYDSAQVNLAQKGGDIDTILIPVLDIGEGVQTI